MKNVVFDFDGTIADTLSLVVEGSYELAGIKLSEDEIEAYRDMTVLEALKAIDIPKRKLAKYVLLGKAYLKKNLEKMKLIKEMRSVIAHLDSQGVKLYIVSSNSAENIEIFLAKNKLDKHFTAVRGDVGIFGKTKVLKKIVKEYKIDKNQSVYVGDEVRDIKSSQKVGLPVVSVTWGFNSKRILSANKPNSIAETPKQLLSILDEQLSLK